MEKATGAPGRSETCRVCGKAAVGNCTDCKIAHYCGASCQTNDWSTHKQACSVADSLPVGASSAAASTPRIGAFWHGHSALSDLMATHVSLTQDLLVAIVKNDPNSRDRAVERIVDNKKGWVRYLAREGVRHPDDWYRTGSENGGLGDGVFLRHSLAAKATFEGVESLSKSDNSPQFNDAGSKAAALLFSGSLHEVVEFWETRRTNSNLTRADIAGAWKNHLICTVEYARQLLIADADSSNNVYQASAEACVAQGRLVGDVMASVVSG